MVGEDTRNTVGSDGILEIMTKPPNPSEDVKRRVFYHWGTSKKGSLGWKYVGKGFELKWLLLYLSKSVRVFLIRDSHMQSNSVYAKSMQCMQAYLHVCTVLGRSPCSPVLSKVVHSKAFLRFLQPKGSSKTHSEHKISSIKEAKLYRNIQFITYLVN